MEEGFKVATLEIITEATPVEGCDNLLSVKAGGITSLVPADLFKKGNMCVVIYEGGILPCWADLIGNTPAGRFLKRSKHIVRKLKLHGIVSEGLFLHPSILEAINPGYTPGLRDVGDEVGDLLGLGYMSIYNDREVAFLPSAIQTLN